MIDWLMTHEPAARLAFFLGVFALLVLWERLAPRRRRSPEGVSRWSGNIGIVVLDTVLLRLAFPMLPVALALVCEQQGWGLFHAVPVPASIAFLASVLLLDLVVYLQHVLFHAVPALWRLHRMHHADVGFDLTTGLRFHPLEVMLSMVIKLGTVAALGAPPGAVLVFEILLNATSMFNHGNVRMPGGVDRVLRWLVVTPDMHRVHHSIHPEETNSNFGFNLPWWDRLLGTYRPQPHEAHETMTIGIEQFRTRRDLRLDQMLIQPWRGAALGEPVNRRWSSVPPR